MVMIGIAAARRLMRQHQGEPTGRGPRLPLWRLLLGEVLWALRQLRREPRVLGALVVGVGATLAVFGAAAPGPVLPWPGRVLVSLAVGLVLARGAWAWISRGGRRVHQSDQESAPAVAATEVVALTAAAVLLGWLLVWVVTLLV